MHKLWNWEMSDILIVNIPVLNIQYTTYWTRVLLHIYVHGLREYVYASMCCIDSNGETSRIAASLYRVGLNACVHYWRQFYICFLFVFFFSFLFCAQHRVFDDSFSFMITRRYFIPFNPLTMTIRSICTIHCRIAGESRKKKFVLVFLVK